MPTCFQTSLSIWNFSHTRLVLQGWYIFPRIHRTLIISWPTVILYWCYRYIQYNPTSLERSYKFEILADHDLGLNIDLVNKDKYTIDYNGQMDPADEKLLEEDILAPQDSKRYNLCVLFMAGIGDTMSF